MQSAAINTSSNAWASADVSTAHDTSPLDGVCALLAVLVNSQTASQSNSRQSVENNAKKLDELKQQLADAVRQAQEAQDSSGFFGFLSNVFGKDLAEIAGAVAAVAAVVATGGAVAPLVLLALSAALEIGSKVGAELGLDPKLCLALSLASAALGLCSGAGTGQAVGALADGARAVETGASVTEGAATVAGGSLGYVAAEDHAASLNHQADATRVHLRQDTTQLDMDDAFQLLERALRNQQRETSTVSAMVKDQADSNNTLSQRI